MTKTTTHAQDATIDLSFIDELDIGQLRLELADRVRLIHKLRKHRDMLLDLLAFLETEFNVSH
jgi:hypothetical protein